MLREFFVEVGKIGRIPVRRYRLTITSKFDVVMLGQTKGLAMIVHLSRFSIPRSHTSKECEESFCMERTKEGKPFCSTHHLELNPYAAEVLLKLATIQDELDVAERTAPNKLDLSGIVARELVATLRNQGRQSVAWVGQKSG